MTKNNNIMYAAVLLAIFLFYMYCNCTSCNSQEHFLGFNQPPVEKSSPALLPKGIGSAQKSGTPMLLADSDSDKINVPKATSVATSLLPRSGPKDDFAEFAPVNLEGAKLVDASKYVRGMTSQSLRNSNLQLRPEPKITKSNELHFNNSTIN